MVRPVTRAMRRREEEKKRIASEEERRCGSGGNRQGDEGRQRDEDDLRQREEVPRRHEERVEIRRRQEHQEEGVRPVTRARRRMEEEKKRIAPAEKWRCASGENLKGVVGRQSEDVNHPLASKEQEKQQGEAASQRGDVDLRRRKELVQRQEEDEEMPRKQEEADDTRKRQEEADDTRKHQQEAEEIRRQQEEEELRQRQQEVEEELNQIKMTKRRMKLKLTVKLALYSERPKIKLNPGMRSLKQKEIKELTWTCSGCNRLNLPQRRLFATLPVLKCECGKKSTVQFDFSLHKIEMVVKKKKTNGSYLVPRIRKQQSKQCLPNSLLSTAEICWRIKSTLEGLELNETEPTLDVEDLLEKYYYMCRANGISRDRASKMNEGSLAIMCQVLATMGVESMDRLRPVMRYQFPYYTAVKQDFSSICQLLADGYVMTTAVYAGKKFGKLKPGKIYKSPRRGRTRHAITLIGAGRRRRTNYYHFLNSWGQRFCMRKRLADPNEGIPVHKVRIPWCRIHRRDKARGGFGLLRAGDIAFQPVTFLRYKDDFKFHPKLEIQTAQGKGPLAPLESSMSLDQNYKHGMIGQGHAQGSCVGP
ncbi:unnamed protein product [Urochloa humidicola]